MAALGLCCYARASLVVASGGYSSSWCADFSLWWLLLLWRTGSRCAGSVVVVHGFSCFTACVIFPDQGSNLCPLHWQVDSYHCSTRKVPSLRKFLPNPYRYDFSCVGLIKLFSIWEYFFHLNFKSILIFHCIIYFLSKLIIKFNIYMPA